jgi:transcription initiation factor TFIIIB Brf1 subunit/transcription initiation factor TFIIB
VGKHQEDQTMTVEAQLCPQCGATIQFVEGRTEVVCVYCGTTVVKSAVPSAVEKELAEEELIQETVGQEKKLNVHGRPAIGKIVAVQTTNIFRQTIEGRAVLMAFALEIQPDDELPFAAEAKALVRLSAVGKYQVGTQLDVRYNPQDHVQVAITGRYGVSDSQTLDDDTWKQRVVNWAADEFRKEQGIDLQQDQQALQRLRHAAEMAKSELSSMMETNINLPFIASDAKGPKNLNLHLSRSKFEQITEGQGGS